MFLGSIRSKSSKNQPHDVNIRRVELGPPSERNEGYASAFLSLYDPPPVEAVEAVRALDSLEDVCLVVL